jgi:para-aminobenzoate synthetase component I
MRPVTCPFVLPLVWQEPLQALTALGDAAGTLGFIGGGTHTLARWSCIMTAPIDVHVWRHGDRGAPFDRLQARLNELSLAPDPNLGPFQGGWAGLLSYELGHAFETLPRLSTSASSGNSSWPDVWLGLYDIVAIFDSHEKRAFIVSWGLRGGPEAAQANAERLAQKLSTAIQTLPLSIGAGLGPTRQRDDAQAAIARAVAYIHDGDIFQANISIRFSGELAKGDTPLGLFGRLVTTHPSPFATYLSLGDKAVVSHSPERFLSRTASGQLETRPIKGTAPRNSDPHIDAANAQALLASEKDRAENLMIVDLMRNDLSRVCLAGSVKVPRLCALESFSTVHHLVSDVIGQQKPGLGFFDALAASFPPGSITGAPKVRAMEIITELEDQARGPWCGSMIRVGFDGSADSSVLIRTAACEKHDGVWRINARAGAGIIADSVPTQEYDEMLVKARALRVAAKNDPAGGSV